MELIKELGCKEELKENEVQQQRYNKLRKFRKSENPYIEYYQHLSIKYSSNLSGEETLKKI